MIVYIAYTLGAIGMVLYLIMAIAPLFIEDIINE